MWYWVAVGLVCTVMVGNGIFMGFLGRVFEG